jgi:hypothetical protein
MEETKPIKLSEIKERNVGNEIMLYDLTGKTIHVLNDTASFIWNFCDGNHTVSDMAKNASELFNIPVEQAIPDIEECLENFKKLNIIS